MIIKTAKDPEATKVNRVFFSQNNNRNGITLVCISAIHGNEPAGYYGLQKVISSIRDGEIILKGNFYALLGNINALKKGVRFHELDLNRLWTKEDLEALKLKTVISKQEHKEQFTLYNEIKAIFDAHDGPFVFVDIHTTSSPTTPFITISDSLNNRSLANKFNIPIVLGIEEYIEGPLLTYINEFGHVSLGFEAGQHQDKNSVLYSEAFVWLVMEQLNMVSKSEFSFNVFSSLLNYKKGFFEIIYRHSVTNPDNFEMLSGFKNFDPIYEDQLLAYHQSEEVKSISKGLIFMPLYQKKGTDGFFIVRKISKVWLLLSSMFRSLKFHELLRILPGISKHPENNYCLIANKRIAFLLTTKVFHLFGYRKKLIIDEKIHFIKRDRKVSPFV